MIVKPAAPGSAQCPRSDSHKMVELIVGWQSSRLSECGKRYWNHWRESGSEWRAPPPKTRVTRLERVRRDLRKLFPRVLKLGNLCKAAVDCAISIGYYGDSSLVCSSSVKVFRVDTVLVFRARGDTSGFGGLATDEPKNPGTVCVDCWVYG